MNISNINFNNYSQFYYKIPFKNLNTNENEFVYFNMNPIVNNIYTVEFENIQNVDKLNIHNHDSNLIEFEYEDELYDPMLKILLENNNNRELHTEVHSMAQSESKTSDFHHNNSFVEVIYNNYRIRYFNINDQYLFYNGDMIKYTIHSDTFL